MRLPAASTKFHPRTANVAPQRRKATPSESNPEEADQPGTRQRARMNYNNFSCRVVIPRSPVAVRPVEEPKPATKKSRKLPRLRLAPTGPLVIWMVLAVVLGPMEVCAVERATSAAQPIMGLTTD